MPIADPHAAAAILYEARRTGIPVAPFTDNDPGLGLADGYAVQQHLVRMLLADGEQIAGEHGIALEPGHLVMTGPMHAAVPMAAGDVFRADFDRLGPVTVRVTEDQ